MKTNIWSYYGKRSGVDEFTTFFNKGPSVAIELDMTTSSVGYKVLDLETRNKLWKNMLFLLWWLIPLVYILIDTNWPNARAEHKDGSIVGWLGVFSVPVLSQTLQFFRFFSSKNRKVRKYVKAFEKLGSEFMETFSPHCKPSEMGLPEWCKSMLRVKARNIIFLGKDGEEYRPAFNRSLDLLVEVGVILGSQVKVWYKEAFEEAQHEIDHPESRPAGFMTSLVM